MQFPAQASQALGCKNKVPVLISSDMKHGLCWASRWVYIRLPGPLKVGQFIFWVLLSDVGVAMGSWHHQPYFRKGLGASDFGR